MQVQLVITLLFGSQSQIQEQNQKRNSGYKSVANPKQQINRERRTRGRSDSISVESRQSKIQRALQGKSQRKIKIQRPSMHSNTINHDSIATDGNLFVSTPQKQKNTTLIQKTINQSFDYNDQSNSKMSLNTSFSQKRQTIKIKLKENVLEKFKKQLTAFSKLDVENLELGNSVSSQRGKKK